MKRVALILCAGFPLCAQTNGSFAFQTFGNPVLSQVRILDEGFGSQLVKGKPFSATEERHFLQVLGDGTRIENTQTNRMFRDGEGRTRVEEMNGTITIYDPMKDAQYQLDPATKTASKQPVTRLFTNNSVYYGTASPLVFSGYASQAGITLSTGRAFAPAPGSSMQGVMSETTENLGVQQINGVPAEGVRTSMIIPKGQIGNTTYQLTKISRGEPDAALFQVPSDYTITQSPVQRVSDTLFKLKGTARP